MVPPLTPGMALAMPMSTPQIVVFKYSIMTTFYMTRRQKSISIVGELSKNLV